MNKTNLELLETINMEYPVLRVLLMEDDENLVIADASPLVSIWNLTTKIQKGQLNLTGHTNAIHHLVSIKQNYN